MVEAEKKAHDLRILSMETKEKIAHHTKMTEKFD